MKVTASGLILVGLAVGAPGLLNPSPAVAQMQAQIEIGSTPELSDEFLCWTPVPSRVRLASPSTADVDITLVSTRATSDGGAVQFQASTGVPITPATFAPVDQLPLTLPKDGTWVAFHVAGKTPSVGRKDVKLQALRRNTSTLLGESLVMVRIRKNANALTVTERDQLLDAFRRVRDKQGAVLDSRWQDYYFTHAGAFNEGIHAGQLQSVSNFLPWHRGFLLSLERELQAIFPTVTIPYWKFDAAAPNLFTADFIGTVSREGTAAVPADDVEVEFSTTNPLNGWGSTISGYGGARIGRRVGRFPVRNSP